MAGMARSLPLTRSFPIALVVAATTVGAGCTGDGVAVVTTTAIVRLPTGFHAARPTDDAPSFRTPAAGIAPARAELLTLRLEAAHRRAAAEIALDATQTSAGFVCQIDMGMTPSD